jgi:hypothetical protein
MSPEYRNDLDAGAALPTMPIEGTGMAPKIAHENALIEGCSEFI